MDTSSAAYPLWAIISRAARLHSSTCIARGMELKE